MKRIVVCFLTIALIMAIALSVGAAPVQEYASIAVGSPLSDKGGADLGAAFIDANSRTLVPLRALANLLGSTVSWDGETKTATFEKGKVTLSFTQNSTRYLLNGEEKQMDTAVVNKDGRVYAPARYLAEAFGYTVGWEGTTRTVTFGINNADVSFKVKSGSVKAADISCKCYRYNTTGFLSTNYDVIIITNNSNFHCKLSLDATYYDKDGKAVDFASNSVTVLAPHTSVAVYNTPDYEYQKVSYQYTLEEVPRYYQPTTHKLSCTYDIAGKNVIGTVTNNGTIAAEFVKVTVLFFKDGQLVDLDRTYAVDSQSEIAAGMKENFKASSYNDFDSVEIYLDSRATNF